MTLLAKLTLTCAIIGPLALGLAVLIASGRPAEGSARDRVGELSLTVAVSALGYAIFGGIVIALEAIWA